MVRTFRSFFVEKNATQLYFTLTHPVLLNKTAYSTAIFFFEFSRDIKCTLLQLNHAMSRHACIFQYMLTFQKPISVRIFELMFILKYLHFEKMLSWRGWRRIRDVVEILQPTLYLLITQLLSPEFAFSPLYINQF